MRSLLLITLLVLASDLRAAETVWITGAGTHSCGKWLDAKKDKASRYQAQQWVFGFEALRATVTADALDARVARQASAELTGEASGALSLSEQETRTGIE